jgi:putative transposase
MSRYRLLPTPAQEAVLRGHCANARYVWNLAVEQHAHWRPGRASAPGYLEQCRQLTEARAGHDWLAQGSQTVQQQALRDFARALAAFFDPARPAGRPSWRKAGRHEGFRVVGRHRRQWDVRRLSRKTGEVWVPKAGWVRFRWSRAMPPGVKSYRVTMDRAGRWHVAFAAIPDPIPAPGTGEVVGIDRGVAVSAAPSTGELLHAPSLTAPERRRMRLLEHKLARAGRGSGRRARVKLAIAAFTSQRCSACGHIAAESRKSQALFACVACTFACNADVNAARNIAAGHAVTARGGDGAARPVNREPQLLLLPA